MSTPHLVMWLIVAVVGIPAAWRNPTAAALVFAWLSGELIYVLTGNNLPISFYFMADIAVVTIIYAKTIWRVGPKSYPTMRQQLYCLFLDLTILDRWVVAIFLLGVWPLYVLQLHPYYKWWLLWGCTLVQFILAGAEAALSFRHDVKERASSDPPDNGLALAGAYRGYG